VVVVTSYTAEPRTPSADGLQLLANWAATDTQPQQDTAAERP
jgi:hypothetical protein